jgi:hypothetical protein
MLDALLKLRDFCDHHSGSYAELKLTEEDWSDILRSFDSLKNYYKYVTVGLIDPWRFL